MKGKIKKKNQIHKRMKKKQRELISNESIAIDKFLKNN